jgi:hypothetical protein
LERLAELRRQSILDDVDFRGLKDVVLGKIRLLIAPEPYIEEENKPRELPPAAVEVPYAQLHAQIVDLISGPYRDGHNPKRRTQDALAKMIDTGAVNPDEGPLLRELLETALTDSRAGLPERLAALKVTARKILEVDNASPATRAIVETAEQSGIRAVEEGKTIPKAARLVRGAASRIWRKLVWPDVEGAFVGGAAGATVYPALATSQLPWPLQMTAAFGVVIGAGIRSGMAYGEAALPAEEGSA